MSTRGYTGKFQPVNPQKYKGNFSNIVYRSSWELAVFRWADFCPDVISWSSEEIVIPYIDKGDGQLHRYFVDLMIEFKSGKKLLVEIKPKSQVVAPKATPGKRRKVLLEEVLTWAKNTSKWQAAEIFAKQRGMTFCIWTEDSLAAIGIKINITRPRKF